MTALLCSRSRCNGPIPSFGGSLFEKVGPIIRLVCRNCLQEKSEKNEKEVRILHDSFHSVQTDPRLSELISGNESPSRKIAALALTYSVKVARNGMFSDPSSLLRRAVSIHAPKKRPSYFLLQTAQKLLINQELWIPVSRPNKYRKGRRSLMRLGPRVIEILEATNG